jgi:hypothetical protein
MSPKTQAERQADYQRRHPDREKAKQARYLAAERLFRERHREDYEALCDLDVPRARRYRIALRTLKNQFPDEWRQILNVTPR